MDYLLLKTALVYNAYAQTNCPQGQTDCFQNPLGNADTVGAVIAKVVGGLWIFAIPISSIFILWGAFQILMSSGEAEKINKGKKTILYAIIGLVLMIFASGVGYVITDILSA